MTKTEERGREPMAMEDLYGKSIAVPPATDNSGREFVNLFVG